MTLQEERDAIEITILLLKNGKRKMMHYAECLMYMKIMF